MERHNYSHSHLEKSSELPNIQVSGLWEEAIWPHRRSENIQTPFTKVNCPMSLQLIKRAKSRVQHEEDRKQLARCSISTDQASMIWIMNLPTPHLQKHYYVEGRLLRSRVAIIDTTATKNLSVSKREVNTRGPGWSPEGQTAATPEQTNQQMALTFTEHPSQTQNRGCQCEKEVRWLKSCISAEMRCSRLCLIQLNAHLFSTLAGCNGGPEDRSQPIQSS